MKSNAWITLDPSLVAKSVRKTPGISYLTPEQAGRIKCGLEIVDMVAMDLYNYTGIHLDAYETLCDHRPLKSLR